MIILTLGGGLGNQMFQYAFARELQEQCGEEIKIVYNDLRNAGHELHFLELFNIPDNVRSCTREEEEYYWKKQNRLKKLIALQLKFFPNKATKRVRFFSKYFNIFHPFCVYSCEEYVLNKGKLKLVLGGYQTWKYWNRMSEKIKSELRIAKEPLKEDMPLLEEMQKCESVCVHVRRGDYVNDPVWKHLNICNEKYYQDAMKLMSRKVKNPVFYLFSNNHEELEWIKENYHFEGYEVRYVDQDHPDYEELRMMYTCKHFIISNSTFSWWGQYLSENEEKVVIAPSEWNREENATDIYMPSWHVVEVE